MNVLILSLFQYFYSIALVLLLVKYQWLDLTGKIGAINLGQFDKKDKDTAKPPNTLPRIALTPILHCFELGLKILQIH